MLNQKTRDTALPDDSYPWREDKTAFSWNMESADKFPSNISDFAERKLSGAPLLADGRHHVCNVAWFHGMQ